MLVPFNVASRVTLPKAERKEVNYFQSDEIAAIRDALQQEPLKWRTLVYMLLITGARRGEIVGLKRNKVNFDNCQIHICISVLYSPRVGVYESTPKTAKSVKYVTLPAEVMELLGQ